MGEIREKIVLTNAYDDYLFRMGQLEESKVRRLEVEGVVDTGAVRSVLPIHIVEQLGLGIRSQTVAKYADGRSESAGVTNPAIFECQTRNTAEESLVLGDEVLIGQTVLEKLDLFADCNAKRLIPHPCRPNQPVFMVR